jgi:pilus assembly protein CpaE
MSNFDLQSLFICPNRELAEEFLRTVPALRAFQVLAELKSYPAEQALEMRMRQLEPDVVLLDVVTDLAAAADLIERIHRVNSSVQVVGLHLSNDREAIVTALRRGASEFLYSPFDARMQQEAIGRLRRLRRPAVIAEDPGHGQVVAFSSTKPGSGASTIALDIALTLERQTHGRVLLIDGDVAGGSIAEILGEPVTEDRSLAAALSGASGPDWHRQTRRVGGIEILPAPPDPRTDPLDLARLAEILEPARRAYDWVVIDLPNVFDRLSLMTVSVADHFYVVTTADLPSLHLTRRALGLLKDVGFAAGVVRILINRTAKREGLQMSDYKEALGHPVDVLIPNDYQAICHRRTPATEGVNPIPGNSDLAKALSSIALRLLGASGRAPAKETPEKERRGAGTRAESREMAEAVK